jgi:hypothetical protein
VSHGGKVTKGTVILVLLVVLIAWTPRSAEAASKNTPSDRLTIVTANLLEGFGNHDLRDMSEMKVFTRRVLDLVPNLPDAMLLQEVRAKSARYVARLMTRKTGQRYRVAVNAAKRPFRRRAGRVVKQDCAIVVNTKTVRMVGAGGYLKIRYRQAGARTVKKNAYAFVTRRVVDSSDRISTALMSTHVPGSDLARRVTRMAAFLRRKYPMASPTQMSVVGGDFNRAAASGKWNNPRFHPWWKIITGKKYGYVDTVYAAERNRGINFIFARRGVVDAGWDEKYDFRASRGDRARFYSNHAFRWAVVENDRDTPTRPAIDRSYYDNGNPSIFLRWQPSMDRTFRGVMQYAVWRSAGDGPFRRINKSHVTHYVDRKVLRDRMYRYLIVATDGTGNRTRSEILEKRTERNS